MPNWLVAILYYLAFILFSTAAVAGKGKPLPPVEQIVSHLPSADEAVSEVHISSEIPVPPQLAGRLFSTPDILTVEIDAIRNLIADRTVPASEKELTYLRYTMGDERLDTVLIAAKNAGIKILVISDSNPILHSKFKKDQKFTGDFSKSVLSDPDNNDGQKSFQRLADAGFVLGQDLVYQPLYNKDLIERVPIMHEKAALFKVGHRRFALLGTSNASTRPRINRMLKIVDTDIVAAYQVHADALAETYRQGRETKDLPDSPLKRFNYRDGTFIELGFTDGKYNLNDRIANEINAAATNGDELQSFTLSHFAPTNRNVVKALAEAIKRNKTTVGFSITDDKFSTNHGWGVTNALENISVFAPFAPFRGFGEAVARRVDSFIWQRRAFDAANTPIYQTVEDGYPNDRYLWHDKTTILQFLKKIHIFTGSFNLSNNSANSENQLFFSLKLDSWFAVAMDYSIKETVKLNPDYAVESLEAVFRSSLAHFFNLGTLDISEPDAHAFIKALRENRVDDVQTLLQRIANSESHMAAPLSEEEKTEHIRQFNALLDWYDHDLPAWKNRDLAIKRLLPGLLPLGRSTLSLNQKASILRDVVWRPDMAQHIQDGHVKAAFQMLGLNYGDLKAASATKSGKAGGYSARAATFNAYVNQPRLALLKKVAPDDITIFDWDDTVMHMPTQIRLFHKSGGQHLDISSSEFATSASAIGKKGSKYEDYELRKPSASSDDNSFVYFEQAGTATDDLNYFRDQMNVALKGDDPLKFMAPGFDAFIERLRNPETAKRTYILTARSHAPEEFAEGIQVLNEYLKQERGIEISVPPLRNFIGVGYANDVPAEKGAKVLMIAEQWAQDNAAVVHFYDDDIKNTAAARQAIKAQAQRDPAVKLKFDIVRITQEMAAGTKADATAQATRQASRLHTNLEQAAQRLQPGSAAVKEPVKDEGATPTCGDVFGT